MAATTPPQAPPPSDSVVIRLARGEDFEGIAAILAQAALETTATFNIHPRSADDWRTVWERTRPFHPWLVAEAGGELLAFARAAAFRPHDAYAWTVEVSAYVAPAHQRRGVARRLYDRLFALLHLQGFHRVLALVTTENAPAIAFHERMGMRRAGHIDRIGYKFDRFLGIAVYELGIQDDHQKPGPILQVDQVADESG
jgi:L-amino acid N-acyltransferase YncA